MPLSIAFLVCGLLQIFTYRLLVFALPTRSDLMTHEGTGPFYDPTSAGPTNPAPKLPEYPQSAFWIRFDLGLDTRQDRVAVDHSFGLECRSVLMAGNRWRYPHAEFRELSHDRLSWPLDRAVL